MKNKAKQIIAAFLLAGLLVAGCGDNRVIDISKLTKHDKLVFSAAVAMEGFDVTTDGRAWYIKAVYGGKHMRSNHEEGRAACSDYKWMGADVPDPERCKIKIRTPLSECKLGGRDRKLFVVAMHEARHVKGQSHSDDPKNIMFYIIPCWPEEY